MSLEDQNRQLAEQHRLMAEKLVEASRVIYEANVRLSFLLSYFELMDPIRESLMTIADLGDDCDGFSFIAAMLAERDIDYHEIVKIGDMLDAVEKWRFGGGRMEA